MKRTLAVLSFVLVAAFMFPSAAMAGGIYEGQVVMGGSFTLDSGEVLDGDLLVLGGNVTLEDESLVRGDVIVFGGNVDCDGEITGDVAVIGGMVFLGSSAVVQGDVQTIGGSVETDEGAKIEGVVVSQDDFDVPFNFQWDGDVIDPSHWVSVARPARIITNIVWYFFRSFLLAGLAVLAVMFWHKPTERVAKAVVNQPLISGGIGLLTIVLTLPVILIMVVLILSIPLIPIFLLVLVLALLFGWIGLGLEVGDRIAKAFKWDMHPAAAAGLGTLITSLIVGGVSGATSGFGLIPCVDWVVPTFVSSLGLGAVILTRFGSHAYAVDSKETDLVAEDAAEDEG